MNTLECRLASSLLTMVLLMVPTIYQQLMTDRSVSTEPSRGYTYGYRSSRRKYPRNFFPDPTPTRRTGTTLTSIYSACVADRVTVAAARIMVIACMFAHNAGRIRTRSRSRSAHSVDTCFPDRCVPARPRETSSLLSLVLCAYIFRHVWPLISTIINQYVARAHHGSHDT